MPRTKCKDSANYGHNEDHREHFFELLLYAITEPEHWFTALLSHLILMWQMAKRPQIPPILNACSLGIWNSTLPIKWWSLSLHPSNPGLTTSFALVKRHYKHDVSRALKMDLLSFVALAAPCEEAGVCQLGGERHIAPLADNIYPSGRYKVLFLDQLDCQPPKCK